MSRILVQVPPALREFTGGAADLQLQAGSLAELLAALSSSHPALAARLVDPDGGVRPYVHLFVDREPVRGNDLQRPLHESAVVSVIPAVAGG
ncbi:MAG: MoaD/ThiS family protein [Lysobacteraceae bacterium]